MKEITKERLRYIANDIQTIETNTMTNKTLIMGFENILGNIVHIKATFIKKWYNVIKSVNDLKDGK